MEDRFRLRIERGDLLIGTIISLPAPEVAEVMSLAGFDWLFIDMEHSSLDLGTAQHILQAIVPGTAGVVRVPSREEVWLKKCLDMGPSGLIIPQLQTPEEVEQVVEFCRYPPAGRRSVGIARAHGYGMSFDHYLRRANEELTLIIQIEHIKAVENISSIVKVPGIDALLVGPYDLSGSLGRIGQVDHPTVKKAIAEVTACAREASLPLGIFGATVDAVRSYVTAGFRLLTVGMDTLLLANAAKEILSSLRDAPD
jgi:2-keto-3-deoxy-L-rhamnonate aldolase RhmA